MLSDNDKTMPVVDAGNEIMIDKTTVLVVEDDANLLSGIKDILELEAYDVLTAQNGVDGLTVLRDTFEQPPDVIVSDVMMPYMDGFSFLEEVRKEDRWVRIPFIFLTAKGEKDDRYRGNQLGADRYLTKPFDAEDLLDAVSSSLKRQRNIARVQKNQLSDVRRQIMTILNHELRTPLTLVVAYAEMLKEYDPSTMDNSDVLTFLRGVNSGANRLHRLIENFIILLDMDSGDAGRTFAWRAKPITRLRDIVRDAYHQIELPEQRPREYELDLPEDMPPIKVDASYMTIVIREMLDNAAKFSENHDQVLLRVEPDTDYVHIHVQDWGRGIPASHHEAIWERFYQINRELYEDQGVGSGLAIVEGIVKLHGGKCAMQSVEGEGSTFTISLPVATED